jgi:hypothetical protein
MIFVLFSNAVCAITVFAVLTGKDYFLNGSVALIG